MALTPQHKKLVAKVNRYANEHYRKQADRYAKRGTDQRK